MSALRVERDGLNGALRRSFRRRVTTGLAVLVALMPTAALAHLGLAANDLYGGMLHPLLHLASLLPMVGLALCLSVCPPPLLWWLVPGYLLGVVLGAVAAWLGPIVMWSQRVPADAETILLVTAGLLGAVVALQRVPPRWFGLPLAVMLGLALGYDNVAQVQAELTSPLLFLAGLCLTAGLVMLHIAVPLYGRRQLWLATGKRVIGSWITAVAVLILTLQLTGLEYKLRPEVVDSGIAEVAVDGCRAAELRLGSVG